MLLSLDYGYLHIVGTHAGHALQVARIGREYNLHFGLVLPFQRGFSCGKVQIKTVSDRSTSLLGHYRFLMQVTWLKISSLQGRNGPSTWVCSDYGI